MSIAQKIIAFNLELAKGLKVPKPFEVLNPFINEQTMEISQRFYQKYYADENERILLFSINPGRLGAGLTGIPFCDPIALEQHCGMANDFDKKPELSSTFIHEMISAWGGPEAFYGQFLITNMCPLGFVSEGKNVNYYDDQRLTKAVWPFMVKSFRQMAGIGIRKKMTISIGMGKNLKFLRKLNAEVPVFDEVEGIAHPRFVMQYRRKQKAEFISQYQKLLKAAQEA